MSREGWTSPYEQWDHHPRPMARTALRAARRAGWWLKKANAGAKVWGVITCGDPDIPGDQRCNAIVHSTSGPADGSETGAVIDNLVRKCMHEWTATDVVDAFEEAERLVTTATRCLDAARSLIDGQRHRELIEDYLKQSNDAVDEAEARLDAALAAEVLADASDATASEAAADAGVSASLGPAALAERARAQAGEAQQLVADDPSREARTLKGKCDDIRNQARTMLTELAQPNSGSFGS